MSTHLVYGALLAAAFVLGLLIGRLGVRGKIKFLEDECATLFAINRHQADDLLIRTKQLARKEDELEAVEAKLLEAEAELVLLRGEGPDAA